MTKTTGINYVNIETQASRTLDELISQVSADVELARARYMRCNDRATNDPNISYSDVSHLEELRQQYLFHQSKLDELLALKPVKEKIESYKHELVEWFDNLNKQKSEAELVAKWEKDIGNYKSRTGWPTIKQDSSYDDWHAAALRFVESDSIEDYNKMLASVRLTHPVPNLWKEAEPIVVGNDSRRSVDPVWMRTESQGVVLTMDDVWRWARVWLLVVVVVCIGFIVIVGALT
jgi:hypothetical protein